VGDEASAGFGPASTVSLVIPAFNEQVRLPSLFERLVSEADEAAEAAGLRFHEALIVDDGSTDSTAELLRAAAAKHERIKPVIEFPHNRGKGAAFAAGARRAEGDFVLLADVDLSTPLRELPKLTAAIEAGDDVAIGSRAVAGAVVERGPVHRKILGNTFNGAVRALTGLPIRDTQNGFKLFPTEAVKRYVTRQICTGFAFDVELLMRARREGLRIAEVPVVYVHDERSRVRVVSASSRMLREVSTLAVRLRLGRTAKTADSPDIVRAA
jgi:glycosyltransferase involved in cell wall biosynthesis